MPILHPEAKSSVTTPLSFTRAAVAEMEKQFQSLETLRLDLDARGRGEALYRLTLADRVFHFFVISQELPEKQKLDRNFAASWDVMAAFCEGDWTAGREATLREQIPLQRAGRADYDTLVYARGNRSGRLFGSVVAALSEGRQPDVQALAEVGYILRTTAFIGNGQLGTRPLAAYDADHPLASPYHAQMCSGLLLREFVFDLVDMMAARTSPAATRLATPLRRFLGLGNSAASGLVPFLTSHPKLISAWVMSDRNALAEILPNKPAPSAVDRFVRLLERAIHHLEESGRHDDGVFVQDLAIAADLRLMTKRVPPQPESWHVLRSGVCQEATPEAAAVADALLLEAEPDITARHHRIDHIDESLDIIAGSTTTELAALIRSRYGWALEMAADPGSGTYFWYRASSAPRDLRRGLCGRAPRIEFETPMDLVPRISALLNALQAAGSMQLADFLVGAPEHRAVAARVQSLASHPAAELAVDFTAADFEPFSPVRQVLSLFGLDKIEAAFPKSVRGTFLQGAPIVEDFRDRVAWRWPYCLMPKAGEISAALPRPPITPVTFDAPVGGARTDTPPDKLRVAPNEISRGFEGIMQSRGIPLGIAAPAARTGAAAVCAAPETLRTLVEELSQEGAASSFLVGEAPEEHVVDLSAGGSHPLPSLVAAIDLVRDRASRFGRAIVSLGGTGPSTMLDEILEAAAAIEASALSLWCCRYEAVPSAMLDWMEADLARHTQQGRRPEVLVFAWQNRETPPTVHAARAAGITAHIRRAENAALGSGLVCARDDFCALLDAASRLFIPQDIEVQLRDEPIDPLTMF